MNVWELLARWLVPDLALHRARTFTLDEIMLAALRGQAPHPLPAVGNVRTIAGYIDISSQLFRDMLPKEG